MAIHTERIRPTSSTTETISEAIVAGSFNRNAFRELDISDPSEFAAPGHGYFVIHAEAGSTTYNVDGGTVSGPKTIRLARYTGHGLNTTAVYAAVLIRSPIKPGEEIELSFYTQKASVNGPDLAEAATDAWHNSDFLGVYYEDDATKWEDFSSKPLGSSGNVEQNYGKGIVPASTSTNLGVTNGGFQHSSGRSNGSYSQARNSNNSANQTDGILYAYNFPAAGTATAFSKFFRVTIKNNSSKPAMLKIAPNVTSVHDPAHWQYFHLYDLQLKLTSPGGGIVKKEDLRGSAVIGSNAANNLSLGGAELVIKSEEGSNRIFTHLDLQLMPTINAQYFLHNVYGASGNYAAATGIFLSFLPNPGVGAPTAADFELRSPYVFMAPKNGRFVCTKLAFNNLQTGTIKVSVYAYSTKTTVGDALTSGFSSYLPGGTTHSHLNTSVTSARTVEATWGTNSTFSAGDLIWVGVEFPTATRTINGYTVIEWTD